MKKILDLGCSDIKLNRIGLFPDYNFNGKSYGLDLNKTSDTDVICDLNNEKIPFENNIFDIVYSSHCLEHIKNIIPVLYDVHRVLKKGGYFLIIVPHVSYLDSRADLTHIQYFGYSTFDFLFVKYHSQLKNNVAFKLIKRRILFGNLYRKIGIEFLANKFPSIYNGFFTGIFPAKEMLWELEKR